MYICFYVKEQEERGVTTWLEVSDHLRLSYPYPSFLRKKKSNVTLVYSFLVPFHLSSDFCGSTFALGLKGSWTAAEMAVPFPLKHQTHPETLFLQSPF